MLAVNEPIIFKYGNILLDDNSSEYSASFLFKNPIEIIIAKTPKEVTEALVKIENAKNAGLYVAGFFSYELGHCFEEKLFKYYQETETPLIFCGIYKHRKTIENKVLERYLCKLNAAAFLNVANPKYSISQTEYNKKIEAIHREIVKGTLYQANFSFDLSLEFKGSISLLFQKLRAKQKAKYGAIINMGEFIYLSQSPELFIKINCDNIETHPMKGTIKIGKSDEENEEITQRLLHDEKNKAENLMIVDLMRNDLSRISKTGTVKVPKLFAIEEYPTLFQMISIIKSELKPNLSIENILRSIFPCGSVTGAPKISAMEIINAQENRSRELYCGSIGYFSKDETILNVAIRTLKIKDEIQMSIGSGIVYDSLQNSEYEECILKAKFLTDLVNDFSILEAILWDGELKNLNLHLERLENSVDYFGFSCALKNIEYAIIEYAKALNKASKIRLELKNNGGFNLSHTDIIKSNNPYKITIAKTRMDSQNPFLYHKTTNRGFYEIELAKFTKLGFDEVIFLNEKDEITEGARTNIFIEKEDGLYTPPLSCGLLNGVLRQTLIQKGAKETILKLDDLLNAKQIYVGNSIRGLKKVNLIL